MKLLFIVLLIFNSSILLAQVAPIASETNLVLQGKASSIRKLKSFDELLLYNNDSDTNQPIAYFQHFDKILSLYGNETIVKLSIDGREYEDDRWAIYNLDQGKMLVNFNSSVFNYIQPLEVILANNHRLDSSAIINIKGDTLLNIGTKYVRHSSLGFFDTREDSSPEIFFDENGNETFRFDTCQLYVEIDSNNFIVQDYWSGVTRIINKKGKTLFADECGASYRVRAIANSPLKYVAIMGLCATDDDSTILFQEKNGKWRNPLPKLHKKYEFIDYICPKVDDQYGSKIVGFYVVSDQKGIVFNQKGKVLWNINDDIKPIDYEIKGPLIQLYIDSRSSFDVYDKEGNKLIPYTNNFNYDLGKEYEKAGYYVYRNEAENLVFIYSSKEKALVTVPSSNFEITNLSGLVLLYESNL